jgi:hypothetical protein
MNVRCTKCGEPWDVDSLHDEADWLGVSFAEVRAAFRADGCRALGGGDCTPSAAGEAAAALADLAGDDLDGWAADLDDAAVLGLL